MRQQHIFFDFDGWTARAEKAAPVYVMPVQLTRPGKRGLVWKENRIQLSQIQANRNVHHCIFAEARWIEHFDSDQERRERSERLDRRYQQLKKWLKFAGFFDVVEGLVSFPKTLMIVETYLPRYITDYIMTDAEAAEARTEQQEEIE